MLPISNKTISEIGSKEKYIRKDHYNSLKVWWARRPITAVRSILINEILRKNKNIKFKDSDQLVNELNPNNDIFLKFSDSYKTKDISVLDVFSGGGSIPFESSRLGCKTYSSELNPIASLLQETNFNFSKFQNYSETLKIEGDKVINNVEERLRYLYDLDGINPYVIFWGKTMKCNGCDTEMSLSRIKYLSKRKTKIIVLENGEVIQKKEASSERLKRGKTFDCGNCNHGHTFSDIKEYCKKNKLGSTPIAICYHPEGKKEYISISKSLNKKIDNLSKKIKGDLNDLKHLIPNESVVTKNGVINPTMYDLKKPNDFFNERQLLVLVTLIDEISKNYNENCEKYGLDYSKQIVLGLTSLIEFLVDWNSTGTMWISQNEQTGRSLAGPGVGMKWDYIEVNPFYQLGSNLRSKLTRVTNTFSQITLNNPINILKGSSTSLSIEDESIDVVLTDPPYFDSIDYTALSEFFRPWFEKLISNTYDSSINLKNDIKKEAIVQLSKTKENVRDSLHYQNLMRDIFKESKRVLKSDGKIIVMYSHKTMEGWEVIANSIKDSGLYVKSSYPLDMERAARPRAMSHQALNGVIIFELIKDKSKIQPVLIDIKDSFVSSDEFNKSHLPIYIASLACKEFSLSSLSFKESYDTIKSSFDAQETISFNSEKIDSLVKLYLDSLVKGNLEDVSKKELDLLQINNLISKSEVKPISEISTNDLNTKSEILEVLVDLFNDYRYNSSTRITLSDEVKSNAEVLFRYLGGSGLNTVKSRSFDVEKKTSRLIMSKLSEV